MMGNRFHVVMLGMFDKKDIYQQYHNANRHPLLYMRHKINKYIFKNKKTLKYIKIYIIKQRIIKENEPRFETGTY